MGSSSLLPVDWFINSFDLLLRLIHLRVVKTLNCTKYKHYHRKK
ncbi:hypothetical protein SPHINGO8BC_110015 [Sphingobacterium multivorum]|uniref:Uncharacterized protein n=1 Tax=Sphingobacterium multivorum TaxID=28454 RepID=A0A653XZT7_SPHMU|nr:hypothetical protein SPHINGO8BC_110015 [Sphingobacterium multivorum]